MKQTKTNGGNVIIASFIVAFILSMLPLPQLLQSIRPEFILIVLIYWCIALPNRIGVGIGWITGLFFDVSSDAILGQHALTFAILAYLAILLHQRIRVFPVWQQALTVLVFMMLQSTISLWIKGMLGEAPSFSIFILPSISTALFWPIGYFILRQTRRYYQIN